MKYVSWLVIGLVWFGISACGPSAARYNNQGNQDYEAGEYDAALDDYVAAELEDPDLAEPYYNAGNAFHRKSDLEEARTQLEQSLRKADDELAQQSHYNLGNNYFQAEGWSEAIDAYKEALRLRPDDVDAKHNLELALKQQQQQLQQQQQQQGGGGQQDQDQPQQGGQQGQQPQPGQQGQGNQGQGQNDQDEPNDSNGGGQSDQESKPQQPGRTELTPDEAEQLLDALSQNNQTLQERLNQRFKGGGAPPAKDW